MTGRIFGRLMGSAGYTAIEALTVVAAMGAVAALTAPNMLRFQAAQQVQNASSEVGGMLQKARARAISEATPQLVLFQDEDVTGGSRTPFALLVSDNDRSYSLTPPDDVEAFTLDADTPAQVRQLGAAGSGAFDGISPASSDASAIARGASGNAGGLGNVVRALASQNGGGSGNSGSGSNISGSGRGNSGSGGLGGIVSGLASGDSNGSNGSSNGSSSALADVVEYGATFPVSSTDAVPALAFNEQGIPVATDTPQEWGSGAGAVYLTDDANAVFAVVITPLGSVELSRYDVASQDWK